MPRFSFACSYLNCVWYKVTDETGTYEAEIRLSLCDYERNIYNGDYDSECGPLIGFLRANCREIPFSTVLAFNDWQAAKVKAACSEMDSNPDRYGIIPANDPLRTPIQARGAAKYIGSTPDRKDIWQFAIVG